MTQKNLFRTCTFAILAIVLTFSSCKKDDPSSVVDTTPPVITLTGDASMTHQFKDAFTDPGFSASDDVDGDLTASVSVSGSVDINNVDSYTLTYSVTDAAGNNTTATRTVGVEFILNDWLGAYTCSEDCDAPYGLGTLPTVTSNPTAGEVTLSPFYAVVGDLICNIDGSTITIAPGQALLPIGQTISGSGSMASDGSSFNLNLTFTSSAGDYSCTATYSH